VTGSCGRRTSGADAEAGPGGDPPNSGQAAVGDQVDTSPAAARGLQPVRSTRKARRAGGRQACRTRSRSHAVDASRPGRSPCPAHPQVTPDDDDCLTARSGCFNHGPYP